MPNDFQKKEPTKTEKLIYELFIQQQGMERSLYTNSALLIAMAMHAGIEPEKLAQMLVGDNDRIKDYSKKINEAIDKLEKEKHKDHNHEGHDHEHKDEAPKTE